MEYACREISKFLISIGEDMKTEERNLVYALLKKYYRNKDLFGFLD